MSSPPFWVPIAAEIPASLNPGVPTLVFQEGASTGVGAAAAPAAGAPFRIYIGDIASAQDAGALSALGITTIVNCCAASCGRTPAEWTPHGARFEYALLFTNDHFAQYDMATAVGLPGAEEQDPTAQWPSVLRTIDAARAAGGSVLIHCAWGINRSTTTAAIFLVRAGLARTFDDAVAVMREKRAQVSPHPCYRKWARKFLREEV